MLRAFSQGFDEFMNVVMDEAEEVWVKQSRKPANDDSKEDSKANGAQTSRSKRQYGDRRTLGEYLRCLHELRTVLINFSVVLQAVYS